MTRRVSSTSRVGPPTSAGARRPALGGEPVEGGGVAGGLGGQLGQGLGVDGGVLADLEGGQVEAERLGLPGQVLELPVGQPGRPGRGQRRLDQAHVVQELAGVPVAPPGGSGGSGWTPVDRRPGPPSRAARVAARRSAASSSFWR